MADITTLDLAPYGINRVLYSGLKEWKAINQVLVARAKYAPGVVTIDDIPYTLKKKLGAGTFGTTFSAKTPDGKIVALKWVKNVKTPFDIQMILREVVIQILLAEFSRKETNGPYVPEIYKVAYDFTLEAGIIVSEMMENTAHNLIASSSVADNNVIVPDMLSQVSESLDFFQKHLKFNHRDLKADNIMYTRNASGKRIYKLIDFGFSCLKWRSLEIKAGQYYSQEAKCFRKERDLAQLCYYILRYLGGNFDLALDHWLEKMLAATSKSRPCAAIGYCAQHGMTHMDGWGDTYDFYNNDDLKSKFTAPDAVTRKMKSFMESKDFNANVVEKKQQKRILAAADPTAICPIGRVAGAGVCAPPVANPAECPPGFIRNPKTRRCVKLGGAVGRAVAKALHVDEALLAPIPKECPPDKVYNPATKRCVKRAGAIGKKIAGPATRKTRKNSRRI